MLIQTIQQGKMIFLCLNDGHDKKRKMLSFFSSLIQKNIINQSIENRHIMQLYLTN